MLTKEIMKELALISERISKAEKHISDFADILHAESNEKISDNSDAVFELADVSGSDDAAIYELAQMIEELAERVSALESKESEE